MIIIHVLHWFILFFLRTLFFIRKLGVKIFCYFFFLLCLLLLIPVTGKFFKHVFYLLILIIVIWLWFWNFSTSKICVIFFFHNFQLLFLKFLPIIIIKNFFELLKLLCFSFNKLWNFNVKSRVSISCYFLWRECQISLILINFRKSRCKLCLSEEIGFLFNSKIEPNFC